MCSQIAKFSQKDVVSSVGFHPSPGLKSGEAESSYIYQVFTSTVPLNLMLINSEHPQIPYFGENFAVIFE